MKHILTATLCLMLASPASALSCLRPDIVSTFEQARDAEAGYWIVKGRISANGPITEPQPNDMGLHKDDAKASTPVRVTGEGLKPDGTFAAFDRDITLSVTCLAHWCGSVNLDHTHFMAIEVKDTGPELFADPCSSQIVPYTADGEERLRRCVQDGVCKRAEQY